MEYPQLSKSVVLSLESTYAVISNYIICYFYDSQTQDLNGDIFWDITLCSSYVKRRFGETYHLQLQGRNSAKQLNLPSHLLNATFLLGWFSTLKWRWYVPPKRCFTYGLHSATSQKMLTFITTTFRTYILQTQDMCLGWGQAVWKESSFFVNVHL
jgi:hypothetical protein